MTRAKIATLVAAIEGSLTQDASPQLLLDVVGEQLLALGQAADLDEALEIAESLLTPIRIAIADRRRIAEAEGVAWVIELYGSADEYVRGAAAADPTLPAELQRARSLRAHAASVRQSLVDLTPKEFEVACTSILRIMGCQEPHTSPISNDGGIDFYGRLELKGRLDNASPYGGFDSRAGVWLVGQAKHYPSRAIQTAHIRELVGSVELARTGGAIHVWDGLRLRPFDAVLQLIFTTGGFSAGALKLLDQSGVIAMNGNQLATFLADAGAGIDEQAGTYDADAFRVAIGL